MPTADLFVVRVHADASRLLAAAYERKREKFHESKTNPHLRVILQL